MFVAFDGLGGFEGFWGAGGVWTPPPPGSATDLPLLMLAHGIVISINTLPPVCTSAIAKCSYITTFPATQKCLCGRPNSFTDRYLRGNLLLHIQIYLICRCPNWTIEYLGPVGYLLSDIIELGEQFIWLKYSGSRVFMTVWKLVMRPVLVMLRLSNIDLCQTSPLRVWPSRKNVWIIW